MHQQAKNSQRQAHHANGHAPATRLPASGTSATTPVQRAWPGSRQQRPSSPHKNTATLSPHSQPRALRIAAAILVAACILIAVITRLVGTSNDEAAGNAFASNATVVDIIDGDTLRVRLARRTQTVRMIGIDTPETVHPTKPVGCFGPQASAFTKSQLPKHSAVRLVLDAESKDKYGRVLAYVYRSSDNTFINLELARRGFAQPLTIPPNTAHSQEILEASRRARSENIGLWASCPNARVTS